MYVNYEILLLQLWLVCGCSSMIVGEREKKVVI